MSKRESQPPAVTDTDAAPTENDPVTAHVRWAVANWPQIDPEVEGIVSRVEKINRYLPERVAGEPRGSRPHQGGVEGPIRVARERALPRLAVP